MDNIDYDISEWLLLHKEGLKEQLSSLHKDTSFFPASLLEIYYSQYEDAALYLIRKEIANSFNLDPESIQTRITKNLIKRVAKDLLLV